MRLNKITKKLFLVLICLILLFILTNGVTYAKYISDKAFNYYLGSKGFYFESVDLKADTNKITDTSWDGGKIYFSLTNSLNEFIASESDIDYEISCEVEDRMTKSCYLDGENKSTITGILSAAKGCINETSDNVDTSNFTEEQCSNYTWTYVPTVSEHYFEAVDATDAKIRSITILVTAKAKAPYEKTISARYLLTNEMLSSETLSLTHESKGSYENVVITNPYNADKCVKLSWDPTELIIDEKSNDYVSYTTNKSSYIQDITFKISKKNSTNFIFYKTDQTKTYSAADFTLVETIECE